jgi:hypothetical protein
MITERRNNVCSGSVSGQTTFHNAYPGKQIFFTGMVSLVPAFRTVRYQMTTFCRMHWYSGVGLVV